MKKLLAIFLFVIPGLVLAAPSGGPLDRAPVNVSDRDSLKRGATLFVNYCLSCHSAQYMRYQRIAIDLGIPEDVMAETLIPTGVGPWELMTVAMPAADSEEWFGKAPPDLSVVTRSLGADWLYTFLRGFYVEEGRPFGVNNTAFKDVGMPHVMWELEGLKEPIRDGDGNITGFETVVPGKLSAAEFDQAVGDLVNFMVYLGEPIVLERKRIGIWVMLFLAFFLVVAYLMKKEYWKDVH